MVRDQPRHAPARARRTPGTRPAARQPALGAKPSGTRWLHAPKRALSGIFNATGETIPLPQHLETARKVAEHSGSVVAANPDWLLAQGVEPWMGARSLPLWLPLPEYAGFTSRDSNAARAAGFAARPLEETLADTLAWELATGPTRPRQAGLSEDDERSLLHALGSG